MNQPRQRLFSFASHQRSLWALPAFGLLLVAAVWMATWLQVRATERAVVAGVVRDNESFVASFEQFTRRAIKDVDRMALSVKFEYEQHQALELSPLIRSGIVDGDGIVLASIIDANGKLVASNQPLRPIDASDRDYFRRHAARDTKTLDISKPVVGRLSGKTVIQMSRRINRRDGSFAGVVLVSVTPEYFTQFYQESDLAKHGSIGLLGQDGIFRARRVANRATPALDGTEAEIVARSERNSTGTYAATTQEDGVPRLFSYRRLADYPLVVVAGQAMDEALADFHRNRTEYVSIAAVATAVIVAFFAVITLLALRLHRHRRELNLQRHFLQTLVDNLPSGIAVRSMRSPDRGRYVLWNQANAVLFGIEAEDALGRSVADIRAPEEAAHVLELDRALLDSPMPQDVIEMRDGRNRGRRLFHFVRTPVFGDDDEVDFIITSATDITEQRARTDELRLASKVFETTADGIILTDGGDRIIMVNAAFSRLTGFAADEMVGRTLAESPFRPLDVAESDARMVELHQQGFVTGEVPRVRKDGTPLSLWVTATCVRDADEKISNYVRVFTDISLLKATQEKLEQLASVDTLTGLPNRRLLHDRLAQALLRADRNETRTALMFIDLDGFKEVNDAYGHDIGDRLLQGVALRLQKCVRASDSLGRVGGDEFAIVLEDASLPNDARHVGERIVASLAAPFHLNGQRVHASASIGIALYPADGGDAGMLLRNADLAMYKAKRSGGNRFQFFAREKEKLAPAA